VTALQREQHQARMRTLGQVRAEADGHGRIQIRSEVLCRRELHGWRLIPKTEIR